ncbi:PAS domain S-box-containing protein [Malonomonas rubra DSM 5091]|uniref:histidine kinase n=1 Tax=Malonomonas rubra DSM 5091 TaxID=1122189 RepID=A0A1M6N4C6_MALRU|nr:ATP-binding protein [Malonomonas rubra]SHJ90537.1 PAS domain S-box-containing protein [Malonomonas rubra DSM 5091]
MKLLRLTSIRKNLTILVALAVLPALAILLNTGMEQRRESIEQAKNNILVLTHSMAQVQEDITRSLQQLLSTLALLPEIQAMDAVDSQELLSTIMANRPDYHNLLLVNLNGDVIAAGKTFNATNLADRKHFQEALAKKEFVTGEFIITRVGPKSHVFPFGYPVIDKQGQIKGVLTGAVNLNLFQRFHELATLPEKGFIALTDSKGIRLLYYPEKATNPIGEPINRSTWEMASSAEEPGSFIRKTSDGKRSLFAFEQVRLHPGSSPYIYVWAGIPESYILENANAALARNLLLMLLATLLAFVISLIIGRKTIVSPINELVDLTKKFALGQFDTRSDLSKQDTEFGTLTTAFHEMAEALENNQKILTENEARFRLIMDSLDALVYVVDMETYEILFLNEFGRKAFGNVIGEICWQHLQTGLSGPCPFCTNKFLLDKNGQPAGIYSWEFCNTFNNRWYFIHDRAIEWVDGRIVRLEIATDITERKRAETQLAEESERLAITLRSIGDGVITTDTAGKIILLNPVAERITGWSQEEARQKPLQRVFETDGENNLSLAEDLLSPPGTNGLSKQMTLIDKRRQQKTIVSSAADIKDSGGDKVGMVLVFRDITEQLRTEQELAKIQKLESLGVLAGGIAHDFNNILAAILGSLDMSLRDTELSEKTKRRLNQALNASYRARDLTLQLLTFAKGGEPIRESASLAEVVIDSADFVLRGDKVACHYHFPDDLMLVDIDKGQISQVVQNIILNAGQAMPGGGVIEVIACNADDTELDNLALPANRHFVKLSISDTGTGIPQEVLKKIFDPYFSTKQQGSGLGLAICHSIISKHGGTISVESAIGKGTCFHIYLPAATGSLTTSDQPIPTFLSKRKGRIMVVDDEEGVRTIATEMLKEMGHDVLTADEGQLAVDIYRKNLEQKTPIDVMIMDLTIPGGMGGEEALQKILAIDPEAKAAVSSGYSNDPVMAKYADYGFSAAIAKPYQFADMAKTINELLG